MKKIYLTFISVVLGLSCFVVYAASPPSEPSGSASFDLRAFILVDGKVQPSSGALNFRGKKYPITVEGYYLQSEKLGAARVVANGLVYGLTNASKFSGTYQKIAGGIYPGAAGKITLKNENGVTLQLDGSASGPMLISSDGAVVQFEK